LNDAVLQVLLVLAFLAIGLISVTFPVYAISVNFLPKQKWEDEKERKKRMDDLQAKIEELTKAIRK
jgi:cell division protein FtsL